jgi:hypothetical protein
MSDQGAASAAAAGARATATQEAQITRDVRESRGRIMETIDVSAIEDTSPMGIIAPAVDTDVSLANVLDAASQCGLIDALEEWYLDSDHPKLVITIEPTLNICTQVTIEYGDIRVADCTTWRIGNALALLFDQCDTQFSAPEDRNFAVRCWNCLRQEERFSRHLSQQESKSMASLLPLHSRQR